MKPAAVVNLPLDWASFAWRVLPSDGCIQAIPRDVSQSFETMSMANVVVYSALIVIPQSQLILIDLHEHLFLLKSVNFL